MTILANLESFAPTQHAGRVGPTDETTMTAHCSCGWTTNEKIVRDTHDHVQAARMIVWDRLDSHLRAASLRSVR